MTTRTGTASALLVEARSVIDDFTVTLRWRANPARANAAVPAAGVRLA